ncbi:hypothetical protein [Roseivirga pacifica]|uniref:hypothetical protein n=1 Tax=Roseivirga pacifica TaxID=1267423 RepID=UPI003BA9F5FA
MTESKQLSGHDQIMSKKTDQKKVEEVTKKVLLKMLPTGSLFQLEQSQQFYFVEHQHDHGTEVYKRNDAAKKIPYTFSSNVSVIHYPNGFIGNDNPLPDQKFGRPVPFGQLKVGQKFVFEKGKSLMQVVKHAENENGYVYANTDWYDPFTTGKHVRVIPLLEGGENA